jgi:hypothetical protein
LGVYLLISLGRIEILDELFVDVVVQGDVGGDVDPVVVSASAVGQGAGRDARRQATANCVGRRRNRRSHLETLEIVQQK